MLLSVFTPKLISEKFVYTKESFVEIKNVSATITQLALTKNITAQ